MVRFDENNNVIENESGNAILVGLSTGQDISYSMQELEGLARAAGVNVLGILTQNAEKVHTAFYIGTGKIRELAELCANMQADLVIFNDELTGMQLRNVEDAVGVKVIDRTILILDIFADRATSREGKMQVEMAQLQYRMPRLLGFGHALSRLGGGIGTRGPGEKKLETDRRHIQSRLDEIRAELKELQGNRQTQRAKREDSTIPVVALVGYTNSGKSSIMNRLLQLEDRTEKQVFEKDMLFATLDTAQRLITLDDNHRFILIDTVGFVSKLPHSLVQAFRSTLDEVNYADLLVHVVDASFEEHDFHMQVTEKVMNELGAGDKPMLTVFNKIDKVPGFEAVGYGKDALCISTKTGEGYDAFLRRLNELLFSDYRQVELIIPYDKGSIVSALLQKSAAIETEYLAEGTRLVIELETADRSRYKQYITSPLQEAAPEEW
ncbi:MAG: GTPase HflX [Firmicutes bacterium]|nr:GTPase HflX [Bacillota bacterium]